MPKSTRSASKKEACGEENTPSVEQAKFSTECDSQKARDSENTSFDAEDPDVTIKTSTKTDMEDITQIEVLEKKIQLLRTYNSLIREKVHLEQSAMAPVQHGNLFRHFADSEVYRENTPHRHTADIVKHIPSGNVDNVFSILQQEANENIAYEATGTHTIDNLELTQATSMCEGKSNGHANVSMHTIAHDNRTNENVFIPANSVKNASGVREQLNDNCSPVQRQNATSFAAMGIHTNEYKDMVMEFDPDDATKPRLSADEWFSDIERTGRVFQWSENMKLFLATIKLRGSARNFLATQTNLNSWNEFKVRLVEAFPAVEDEAQIHLQMA